MLITIRGHIIRLSDISEMRTHIKLVHTGWRISYLLNRACIDLQPRGIGNQINQQVDDCSLNVTFAMLID